MDESYSNISNTPPWVAWVLQIVSKLLEAQQFDELAEFGLHEWFGENVCQVFVHWYVFDRNFPVFNSFLDEVILYVNVLGPSMEFVVLQQCNCPLIVTIM